MPNYAQIEQQITSLGISLFALPSTELKALPNVLHDAEEIIGIASGLYKSRNGILVATSERVIFFDKGRLWGERIEEFRYGSITSVEYATGLISGEIIIYSAGNAEKIGMVPKALCKPFADAVRDMLSERKNLPVNSPSNDMLSKLERLVTLKNSGMLTDEEFRVAKSKLLNL